MVQCTDDHENTWNADVLGSAAESGTTWGSCVAGSDDRDRDARVGDGALSGYCVFSSSDYRKEAEVIRTLDIAEASRELEQCAERLCCGSDLSIIM